MWGGACVALMRCVTVSFVVILPVFGSGLNFTHILLGSMALALNCLHGGKPSSAEDTVECPKEVPVGETVRGEV